MQELKILLYHAIRAIIYFHLFEKDDSRCFLLMYDKESIFIKLGS